MAAICISIELYEIVQLQSGDGVALPLTFIVGAVGLTLRGGVRLLGQKQTKNYFSQNCSLIRSDTVVCL